MSENSEQDSELQQDVTASTFRQAFEYAACIVGIAASFGTGLADPGSSLQVASAILMGTAYGTAYVLKH